MKRTTSRVTVSEIGIRLLYKIRKVSALWKNFKIFPLTPEIVK